jgi:hypothetical protein
MNTLPLPPDSTACAAELTLFALLNLLHPGLEPRQVKIHCAVYNGSEDPIDLFLAGRFEEWQRWQKQRNFERPFVVSLIATGQKHQWMFAGLYRSFAPTNFENDHHYYPLIEDYSCTPLKGRLFVRFEKLFRQPYPFAEKIMSEITVTELRDAALSVARFPGFRKVDLSREELCLVHRQQHPDWVGALSSVAGVYLISDTLSGKLYVGSASGQGGIWQRWSEYVLSGHGGNVELKALLAGEGEQRARHFRYAILEITDVHDDEASVLKREAHWKRILLSRSHGLNRN